MGNCERKQQSLYNEMSKTKDEAQKLLKECKLLRDYNTLEIKNGTIIPCSGEQKYQKGYEIKDFYLSNDENYVFKLADGAIITLCVKTDDNGEMLEFSYTFCSCPFWDDILMEMFLTYDFEEISGNEDENKCFYDQYLDALLKDFNKNKNLIDNIIDLSKNPIYIRCDFDSRIDNKQHPKFHLTLNFISNSRFKIDDEFDFKDFVMFILDIVYGIKGESCNQYAHIRV